MSIKSVEGFITQQFTILYDDGAKVASPPPQKHRLAKVDRLRASPMLTVPICTNDCDTQTGQPRFDVTGRLLSEPLLPCSECHGDSSTSPTRTPPCCPPSGDADKLYRDAEPLIGRLEANTSFNYSRTFRVPTDDHIRPTTHEATETRIRVAHKLSVEVKYRVAGSQEDRVLMLSKDVVIASVSAGVSKVQVKAFADCHCHPTVLLLLRFALFAGLFAGTSKDDRPAPSPPLLLQLFSERDGRSGRLGSTTSRRD